MAFEPSELILNEDGSIYHLHLKPKNIASTIITVGDPDRVDLVASFFDQVEFKIRNREFHTQTGTYKGKRITVISTGIGTDNIDIVLNELDALVNINLEKRTTNKKIVSLNIVRIGTSGSIQEDIPVDSFLLSATAIGFDSLLHYYDSEHLQRMDLLAEVERQVVLNHKKTTPYIFDCDAGLKNIFLNNSNVFTGITATNVGFYGPQGRRLRAATKDKNFIEILGNFNFENKRITNLEMETSGIYGLSKVMGHHAISMNVILANRATGRFSRDPEKGIKELIAFCLDKIVSI